VQHKLLSPKPNVEENMQKGLEHREKVRRAIAIKDEGGFVLLNFLSEMLAAAQVVLLR
jgi:hypothetical protein